MLAPAWAATMDFGGPHFLVRLCATFVRTRPGPFCFFLADKVSNSQLIVDSAIAKLREQLKDKSLLTFGKLSSVLCAEFAGCRPQL